jgi:release factor glutamine methyltransferase
MLLKDFLKLVTKSITVYPPEEAGEIAFLILEKLLNINTTQLVLNPTIELPNIDSLNQIVSRVNKHEPIQYLLEEAWFCNKKFFVNKNVLIPRPETEQIIDLALKLKPATVVDLGTGSGCIPISLALASPITQIFGVDISEQALEIANFNKNKHKVAVAFKKADILNFKNPFKVQKFDLIISNPPYVKKQEIAEMRANVVDYEPHLALFVENDDPLIFYNAIASIANDHLQKNGNLIVEINSALGQETAKVFKESGFKKVEIIKDFFDRDRFVMANR